MNDKQHITNLDSLIAEAKDVAAEWNGDDAGVLEDRAQLAIEIAEEAENLQNLIQELYEL